MGSVNFNVGYRDEERDEVGYKIKDLAIPLEINQNNYDITVNTDLNAIREAIHNIFDWFKGERILNPLFGNPILEFVNEPINADTSKRIALAMSDSIQTWDSRIQIKSLTVDPNPDENQYNIVLLYDVPVLNLYNMSYDKLITIED